MMASRSSGAQAVERFTIELAADLYLDLMAFCRANYRAPQIEVIREALREHMDRRLKEPGLKERFETARRELARQRLTLVDGDGPPRAPKPPRTPPPEEGG